MSIDTSNIKIIVKPKKSGSSTVAIVDLLINGVHKIKGFTVMTSKFGGYVVYPPRNQRKDKKWEYIYFCEDKEFWKKLEKKIIEKYNNKIFEKVTE